MTFPYMQTSFVSGELSPSVWGRVDKPQYKNGASTMRNFVVNYRGGAMSRAGFKYVGMCKQAAPNDGGTATDNPPRDINFQYNINQGFALEFGDQYMRVKFDGAYVTEATKTVTSVSIAGLFTTSGSHDYSVGDWIFDEGNTGFSGLTWIVKTTPSATTFTVTDLFGNTISSATASAAGTVARIYTAVSPYAAIDLPYLKFTQSANTMNLACWNQETNTEYPPYNLVRISNINWTFTQGSFGTTAVAPSGVSAVATNSTTKNTWYGYAVTSIYENGDESVSSTETYVQNNNISINAGSNTISWSARPSATSYNVYASTPIYNVGTAQVSVVGANFGFLGSAFGNQFVDTNILPDFTITPPIHNNPFARGAIIDVNRSVGGSGGSYTQSTISYSIGTTAGTGFAGTPIVVNGQFSGFYIKNSGENYKAGDVMTIADSGPGHGAAATLIVGPQTGTYPGTVQYFQQRLVYADTINQPDTYFMSRPGLYSNFDSSIPVVDSDAIIGTPWAVQINGIQFMMPTISGLLMLTGNGVWLVNGGSAEVSITPSDQKAQAQAQIGCSALVPPLYVNLHVLYVQAKNSIVRDVAYDFLNNVFKGTDITLFSNHLFSGYTLLQWAYSEEPFKVVWAVRNDGTMLSLTYIKEQEIEGWARHDTNGLFIGVCSVIEPPVDAIYVITKRYILGEDAWAFYSERADNRQWQNVEDCFCVDAGLAYPMTYPDATLTPAAAEGTNNITSTFQINGGAGYTSPTASAVDSTGLGSGAVLTCTVVAGVITAITPTSDGQDYTAGATDIIITDATGTGAVFQPVITNYVNFRTGTNVSSQIDVDDVIRVDGGKATVISVAGRNIVANVTQPLTDIIPNDPEEMPVVALSGDWSVSTPVTEVSGLNHLEGMEVTGLADGGVIVPQTVVDGSISLQDPASAITVGLGFTAQLQTTMLEIPAPTTNQGKRKNVQAVTARVELTRGIKLGSNKPDASSQPNQADVPWTGMIEVKDRNMLIDAGSAIPLMTNDTLPILVPGDWDARAQIAVEQSFALPATINALIPRLNMGDSNG